MKAFVPVHGARGGGRRWRIGAGDLHPPARNRIVPPMSLQPLPGIAALLAAFAVLAGAGGPVAAANILPCGAVHKIALHMMKRHVLLNEFDQEIRVRAADNYILRIDPSRTLLLEKEAARIRRQLVTVLGQVKKGNCAGLDRLHEIRQKRVRATETHARRELSRETWQPDPSVELTIDSKKRGYPKTAQMREALYNRLLQLRVARLMQTGAKLDDAKKRVIHQYELLTRRIGELDSGDVYSALLDSVARALDPHSSYLSAEQLEDFSISSTLSLEGIGAQLRSRDGYTVIVRVIPGAPADRQGQLQQKDKIVAVTQDDGTPPVDIIDWSLRDVVRLIRGAKGTRVHLTILRQGETVETLQIAIVRDRIDLKQRAAKLRFHTIERGGRPLKLAIIELPTFYGDNRNPDARQSDDDVAAHLREASEQGAGGVLLDLSRNAGGLLAQAVKIAGLFLDTASVVQIRDPQSGDKTLRDRDGEIAWSGPLVVLTSRRSASASEIVGATLQDYARAVIAGDGKTYGKGTVQTVSRLLRGLGAVKVTTGFFFGPGGRSVQNIGVVSDVVIPPGFNTDGMGESKRPYTLPNQTIPPVNDLAAGASGRPWKPVTQEKIARLAAASKARVAASEPFARIAKKIETARQRAGKGLIRIADLLKESDGPVSDEAGAPGDKNPAEANKAAAPEAKLSAYHLEALEILADHVTFGGR